MNVKGLLKNINDITIVTAFRQVVTVAAAKAPHVRTNIKTICIPKYPDNENKNAYPYVSVGC